MYKHNIFINFVSNSTFAFLIIAKRDWPAFVQHRATPGLILSTVLYPNQRYNICVSMNILSCHIHFPTNENEWIGLREQERERKSPDVKVQNSTSCNMIFLHSKRSTI